jgi:predicted DNA-binding transcriptional regulator AlpA
VGSTWDDGGPVLAPDLAAALADALERAAQLLRQVQPAAPSAVLSAAEPVTWRTLLWTCTPETRLGVVEVAEALGKPKSWVYRATSARSNGARLPHRKLGGELVFVAAEVRRWVADNEVVVVPGRTAPPVVGPAPTIRLK